MSDSRTAHDNPALSLDKRSLTILETMSDACMLLDNQWQVVYINPQAEPILQRTREELIGKNIWDVFPVGVGTPSYNKYHEALETLQPVQFVEFYLVIHKWIEARVYPTAEGLTIYFQDVTPRIQAQQELRRSEDLSRFIMESMPQKIFTAKPDGAVDYFNQQWMEYTGLTFEQIRDWGWTQFIHPEDVEENVRLWQHSIDTGEQFQFVHRFRRNDGVYRWHLSRALPMRNDDGTIVMWIGSNTDIHDQKELEQRKDDFISMASHELKTPITTLKGLTQILLLKFERQGMQEPIAPLTTMEKQIDRLTRLISELLDVSKIQAGRLEYDREPVDIDALVRETVEMLQPSNPTHTIVTAGATSATIQGDKDRLGQVLTNLISNAVKYSPQENRVDIVLAATSTTATICVRDYGVGIPKAHQDKIFERFYRVFDAHDKTFPGLGMGLYIACEIVLRHGGHISIDSEEGKGSTFIVSLPRT